eukprot:UN12049
MAIKDARWDYTQIIKSETQTNNKNKNNEITKKYRSVGDKVDDISDFIPDTPIPETFTKSLYSIHQQITFTLKEGGPLYDGVIIEVNKIEYENIKIRVKYNR